MQKEGKVKYDIEVMNEQQHVFLVQLGKRIKELRSEKDLSQQRLGKLIGKEQKAINRIENAQTNPSAFYLYQIAKGLGVSLRDLVDFDVEE